MDMQMRSKLLGCAFLGCTALAWVAASFLAQYLVAGEQPSLHPFLLTYICTSMFTLYLPVIHIKGWLGAKSRYCFHPVPATTLASTCQTLVSLSLM